MLNNKQIQYVRHREIENKLFNKGGLLKKYLENTLRVGQHNDIFSYSTNLFPDYNPNNPCFSTDTFILRDLIISCRHKAS